MTGPVPPHIEAIRNQTGNALRYIAEFAEDQIFALLGNLKMTARSIKQGSFFDLSFITKMPQKGSLRSPLGA
eukprot:4366547-Pyramimonas_sp.AAC.1